MDIEYRLHSISISEKLQKTKMIFDFRRLTFSDKCSLQKAAGRRSAGRCQRNECTNCKAGCPAEDLFPSEKMSESIQFRKSKIVFAF